MDANQMYQDLVNLQNQVLLQRDKLDARWERLAEDERRLRQGIITPTSPKELEQNLRSILPLGMAPGNVGDLNRIIWPFFFTTDKVEMPPNSTQKSSFTITQEAAFSWVYYIKAVWKKEPRTSALTYIDPEDYTAAGKAPGLSMLLRDSQSSRIFHNNPLNLDHVGSPRFPSTLPSPMLLLPNSNMEITFTNANVTDTYVPFVSVFGYRVRIEDAQNILSLQYA